MLQHTGWEHICRHLWHPPCSTQCVVLAQDDILSGFADERLKMSFHCVSDCVSSDAGMTVCSGACDLPHHVPSLPGSLVFCFLSHLRGLLFCKASYIVEPWSAWFLRPMGSSVTFITTNSAVLVETLFQAQAMLVHGIHVHGRWTKASG